MWIAGSARFMNCPYLDETDFLEREANIFAAEFLIDDTSLFDVANSQADFFQIASLLNVPPELLDFKLRLLKQQGTSYQCTVHCAV